jgi:hypothetical protein
MHLKAIQIKESLLGKEDYEVSKCLISHEKYLLKIQYCLCMEGSVSRAGYSEAVLQIRICRIRMYL